MSGANQMSTPVPSDHIQQANATDKVRLRTLNVEIPDETYWHVRRCATESRLSPKEFVSSFCREAHPYRAEQGIDDEPVPSDT